MNKLSPTPRAAKLSRRCLLKTTPALLAAVSPVALPVPAVAGSEKPASLSVGEALESLTRLTGRLSCWVGAPPSTTVPVDQQARPLNDTVREWAQRWGAAVLTTPDGVFFHTRGSFDQVRPAHQDPLLPRYPVVECLDTLAVPALAQFPLGPGDVLSEAAAAATLQGAVALTQVERAAPGFAARLRRLLKAAGAEQYAAAPSSDLHLRLQATLHVNLWAGPRALQTPRIHVDLPISQPTRWPEGVLTRATDGWGSAHLRQGSLGGLVRGGQLVPKQRAGPKVVVDPRLDALPLTFCRPPAINAEQAWAVLEAGIGVERRDLGEVHFYGPWLDAEGHAQLCLLSRWAAARGQLWETLFSPHSFNFSEVPVAKLSPAQLHRLRLRLAQATRDDPEAAKFPHDQFYSSGRVSMGQSARLEVLRVAPAKAGREPALLGAYPFFL